LCFKEGWAFAPVETPVYVESLLDLVPIGKKDSQRSKVQQELFYGSRVVMKDVVLTLISRHLPIVLAVFLVGCASEEGPATGELNPFFPGGTQAQQGEENVDTISHWYGDGIEGRPSILIDLETQRAYFRKGGQIVGVSVVSTGREGHDTPQGKFRVTDKDIDHASSLYGDYVDQSGQDRKSVV
jgi:hypothetical protein